MLQDMPVMPLQTSTVTTRLHDLWRSRMTLISPGGRVWDLISEQQAQYSTVRTAAGCWAEEAVSPG
jgi:hypothetical protein